MEIKPELKISETEFLIRAVKSLTKPPWDGCHFIYSGAWSAFKEYFGPESDPVKAVDEAVKQGKIYKRPSKGGFVLYLSPLYQSRPKEVLKKMGLIE